MLIAEEADRLIMQFVGHQNAKRIRRALLFAELSIPGGYRLGEQVYWCGSLSENVKELHTKHTYMIQVRGSTASPQWYGSPGPGPWIQILVLFAAFQSSSFQFARYLHHFGAPASLHIIFMDHLHHWRQYNIHIYIYIIYILYIYICIYKNNTHIHREGG